MKHYITTRGIEDKIFKKIKARAKALDLTVNRYVKLAIEKDLGINNLVDIEVKVKK